jgi:hypothetical protein
MAFCRVVDSPESWPDGERTVPLVAASSVAAALRQWHPRRSDAEDSPRRRVGGRAVTTDIATSIEARLPGGATSGAE